MSPCMTFKISFPAAGSKGGVMMPKDDIPVLWFSFLCLHRGYSF
jgi:hypothetical protein